jgi:hypothetical protein
MDYEFEVPFEDGDEPGTAEITITNLSEQTRRGLQRNHPVIINAGYVGDVGLIFKGAIASMSSVKDGVDWKTTITALEVGENWLTKQVNKTYKEGATRAQVVHDLCGIFGVEVARMELKNGELPYPGGFTCAGKVKDYLRQIVVGDCKSRFLIRNGRIYITDPSSPINSGFLLAAHTGLLAADEDFEDAYIIEDLTSAETWQVKEDSTKLHARTCLLNYQIGSGDVIMIQSKSLNGRFQVVRGNHRGGSSGVWHTDIEVRAI